MELNNLLHHSSQRSASGKIPILHEVCLHKKGNVIITAADVLLLSISLFANGNNNLNLMPVPVKELLNKRFLFLFTFVIFISLTGYAQNNFNGIDVNLGNLYRLSNAESRSISPENFTGEKGKGGIATEGTGAKFAEALGRGWKVSPSIKIKPGTTFTIADIKGPGSIQHIWMTPTGNWRFLILRIYWDDEKEPSVECPVGDFFCMGWGKYSSLQSLAVAVNPGSGFNCYWRMPFHKHCRITIENIGSIEATLYYQVDYVLTGVPKDAAYFHAQFRTEDPVPYGKPYVLVDSIRGEGQYVGTYIALEARSNGWWGEGEIKFYIDGDKQFPTICGTGTEDYFGGSYDFDSKIKNSSGTGAEEYTEFSSPYSGLPQVIRGDGHYNVMQRFGMYRWHITDPIRFKKNLVVTIQDLGWGDDAYRLRQDKISSVAFWYQTEPHTPFPKLPGKKELEIY